MMLTDERIWDLQYDNAEPTEDEIADLAQLIRQTWARERELQVAYQKITGAKLKA